MGKKRYPNEGSNLIPYRPGFIGRFRAQVFRPDARIAIEDVNPAESDFHFPKDI